MIDDARIVKIHPSADLLPPMKEADYIALYKDIQEFGLREKIRVWVHPDTEDVYVVDGRHRMMALEALHNDGQKMTVGLLKKLKVAVSVPSDLKEDQFFDYALSLNVRRRHLTAEEVSIVYSNLRKADPERWEPRWKRGRPKKGSRTQLTRTEKAQRMGTSLETVKRLDKAAASSLARGLVPEGTAEEHAKAIAAEAKRQRKEKDMKMPPRLTKTQLAMNAVTEFVEGRPNSPDQVIRKEAARRELILLLLKDASPETRAAIEGALK